MKVTKKINHDSLWVKVTDTKKRYFKILINRRGISSTSTMTQEDSAKFEKAFNNEYKKFSNEKLSYGELIDNTEKAFNELIK